MRLSAESSFLILRQTSSFLCSVTVLKIVMRKTNTAFNLSGSEESSLVENAHFINSGKINAKLSTAQTHLSIAACLPFLLLLLSLLHLGAFSPFPAMRAERDSKNQSRFPPASDGKTFDSDGTAFLTMWSDRMSAKERGREAENPKREHGGEN